MKILENIEINYSNEKIDYLDSINFMEKNQIIIPHWSKTLLIFLREVKNL